MEWQTINRLEPGRLAFLMFEHLESAQWVGYVDQHGNCAWPPKVAGLRPSAWQELVVNAVKLALVGK